MKLTPELVGQIFMIGMSAAEKFPLEPMNEAFDSLELEEFESSNVWEEFLKQECEKIGVDYFNSVVTRIIDTAIDCFDTYKGYEI